MKNMKRFDEGLYPSTRILAPFSLSLYVLWPILLWLLRDSCMRSNIIFQLLSTNYWAYWRKITNTFRVGHITWISLVMWHDVNKMIDDSHSMQRIMLLFVAILYVSTINYNHVTCGHALPTCDVIGTFNYFLFLSLLKNIKKMIQNINKLNKETILEKLITWCDVMWRN